METLGVGLTSSQSGVKSKLGRVFRTLTRLTQGLSWLDVSNARVVDGHERGGVEGGEERGYDSRIGEVGLDGFNTNAGIVGLSESSRNERQGDKERFDHREQYFFSGRRSS